MVARCLEHDRRFGVVYHDSDLHGPFLMEEGRVGTVAEILEFQPLPDGRSLVATRGMERFSIRDGIESEEPFYEAVAQSFEDRSVDGDRIVGRRRRSIELFGAVLETLRNPPARVPTFDPGNEVSFPLAATVEIEAGWRQDLLEIRSEERRLDRLDLVFQAAIDSGAALDIDREDP